MALSEALKCAASVIENAPLCAEMYGTGVGTSTYFRGTIGRIDFLTTRGSTALFKIVCL
jgi:hypothetical protein